MRRTERLQGLRLMKFEDVYGRCYRGDLSQLEASEILGACRNAHPGAGETATRPRVCTTDAFLLINFCLIFVPFGHDDGPEILS